MAQRFISQVPVLAPSCLEGENQSTKWLSWSHLPNQKEKLNYHERCNPSAHKTAWSVPAVYLPLAHEHEVLVDLWCCDMGILGDAEGVCLGINCMAGLGYHHPNGSRAACELLRRRADGSSVLSGSVLCRVATDQVKNRDEKPSRWTIPRQLSCNINDVFTFSPRGKLQSFMSQLTLYKLFWDQWINRLV